jgi:hypothetical protein
MSRPLRARTLNGDSIETSWDIGAPGLRHGPGERPAQTGRHRVTYAVGPLLIVVVIQAAAIVVLLVRVGFGPKGSGRQGSSRARKRAPMLRK